MRAHDVDARRYVWARGNALWLMGPPISQWMEDLEGAAAEGQSGLVRHVARQIGETCAAMAVLAEKREKPMPGIRCRAAWALARTEGSDVHEECLALVRGAAEDEPDEEIVDRCRRLVAVLQERVGTVPNVLSADGYYPGMALVRDWLELLTAVGEPSILPSEWTKGAEDA
jgi:hypothetical protein